ncbi:MAG: AhpC/TSA family protein [Planctomycetes bacterium]|nr:AhpC/TSA family protein [Planctomycetota bacterium]
MAQLRQHEERIERLGLKVLVVTFQAQWLAEAYVSETELRWPLLVDETRELFTAYGMHRGRWRDILGPAAMWAYAKLIARGRRPKKTTGDVRQLGGDVLIDPAGVVRLHHVGRGPADRPPVERILSMVEE